MNNAMPGYVWVGYMYGDPKHTPRVNSDSKEFVGVV